MYICYVCKQYFESPDSLKFHVVGGHILSGSAGSLVCGQEGCLKCFSSVKCWYQHIRKFHHRQAELGKRTNVNNIDIIDNDDCECEPESDNIENVPEFLSASAEYPTNKKPFCDVIRNSGIQFVADLRSNSSVTASMCEKAAVACDDVALKEKTANYLQKIAPKVDHSEFLATFDESSRPLDFLEADSRQLSYFSNLDCYVKPVEYVFGAPRHENRFSAGQVRCVAIYDSWQYIPLESTLKAVLSQEGVLQELLAPERKNDGLVRDFSDGAICGNHPLVTDRTKLPVILELYYDDIEPANQLGSKATVHKIGIFYFTIRNLPSYFNKCLAGIHLLALAYTNDLKKYGYSYVLDQIASDIRTLESDGSTILAGSETIRYFASIGIVTGDNLGCHTIFGLMESFRAHHFCRTCLAKNADIQNRYVTLFYKLRSLTCAHCTTICLYTLIKKMTKSVVF